MSNLRLIDDTTISNVASASITDVFSSDYDIYKIVATGYATTSGTAGRARLRFINPTGSIETGSTYDSASLAVEAAATSAFPEVKATNVSYMDFLLYDNGETGGASAGVWWIFNPFSSSEYTMVIWEEAHYQASYGGSSEHGNGIFKDAGSMAGYNIHGLNGGNFNVRFRTYGLRRD